MTRWLIVFAVISVLVTLYTSGKLRLILLGITAATILSLMVVLYNMDMRDARQNSSTNTTPITDSPTTKSRPVDITTTNLASIDPQLTPGQSTSWDRNGATINHVDPRIWQFHVTLANHTTQKNITEVVFHINLYSCPDFYKTAQAEADLARITQICTRIGERQIAFYDLYISPNTVEKLHDSVNFGLTAMPSNWRYYLSITSAKATTAK